jgi:Lantibiotic dehydratase, N terminus
MILIRAGGLPFQPNEFEDGMKPELENAAALEAAMRVQAAFDDLLADQPESPFRSSLYNARKAFFQKQKMPAEGLLRELDVKKEAPLVATLMRHLRAWEHAARWEAQFDQAYERRLTTELERLQQRAADQNLRRALLFASHDLLDRLPEFCAKAVSTFNKKDRQTAISVLQYLNRSVFKTSPLSRFGAVQLWRLGQEQDFGFEADKIAVTPNVAMLPALYEVLLRVPSFYESLSVALNPSFSINKEKGSASTWLYFDGEQEAFQQLGNNPVVELIVETLLENDRKMPYPKLLEMLSAAVDAAAPQLESLLRELIDFGLLAWQLPETGLSPSWPGNLAIYLSHLPTDPVLTDTTFLLQLLRVSARAMPYQSLEAAQQTQREAKEHLDAFFEKQKSLPPPIPSEQIFFEDLARSLPNSCPEDAIRQFAQDLTACWEGRAEHELNGIRARLHQCAQRRLKPGETIDFLEFCRLFFEDKSPEKTVMAKRYDGKLGVMLQVYHTPEGHRAVVNAMFPGGGKLYARWLHLFPSDFKESLPQPLLFPWQGWSNANFQPLQSREALLVPDGRAPDSAAGATILLSDLGVYLGDDGPVLVEKDSGKQLVLTDLGLESPESRPPAMQVLWHLGVPYVSSLALIGRENYWVQQSDLVKHRQRMEYRSLVLARAAWETSIAFFQTALAAPRKSATRFRLLREALAGLRMPRYFFARRLKMREKPQYFDMQSPVSMLLFEKMLELDGETDIFIEEMLPTPAQWVMGNGKYAGEFVVEF